MTKSIWSAGIPAASGIGAVSAMFFFERGGPYARDLFIDFCFRVLWEDSQRFV